VVGLRSDRDATRVIRTFRKNKHNPDGEIISVDIPKEHPVKELETLRQHKAGLEKLKAEYRRRTKALLQVEEEERRHLAREIHDDISQPLTALKINVSWLRRRVPKGEEPLLEKLEQISELNDSITRSVQRISLELRPAVLDDLGLTAAIEWQVGYFREVTGIKCDLSVEPANITIGGQIATAIFCILRKILTHVAQQASATRVKVTLNMRADKLHLKVIDNGEGIKEEQILDRQSFGLMEIGEHAQLFGGEVKITRNPHQGITVKVNIPLNQEEGDL
jgi:signal transduction histidine kinase